MTKKMILAVLVLLLSLLFIACDSPCAHGGDIIEKVIVEADCETKGLSEHICVNCGEVIKKVTIDYGGHAWKKSLTQPTCLKDGKESVVCSRCNEVQSTVVLPASGHTWKDVQYTYREATCTHTGGWYRVCTNGNCDLENNEELKPETTAEDKLPHDFREEVIVAATCTVDGISNKICNNCGYKEEIITTKEHEVVEDPELSTPATCINPGESVGKCSECGMVETVIVGRLGHKFTSSTCDRCGTDKPSSGLSYTFVDAEEGTEDYFTVKNNGCTDTKIIIADYYSNDDKSWFPVKSIEAGGFKSNETAETIVVPATIESIGNNSFSGCSDNLKLSIRGEYNRFTNMASWGAAYTPDRLWPDYADTLPKVSEKIENADFVVGQSYVDEDGYILTVFYKTSDACYAYDPMAIYNLKWGASYVSSVEFDTDYLGKITADTLIKDLPAMDVFENNIGKGLSNTETALSEANKDSVTRNVPSMWTKVLERRESTNKVWFIPSLSECYHIYNYFEENNPVDSFTTSSNISSNAYNSTININEDGTFNLKYNRSTSLHNLILAKKIY